jgi:hypothetical protein
MNIETPFLRLPLRFLKCIRDNGHGHNKSALRSIVLALFEIANTTRSLEFTVSQSELSRLSGMTDRTLRDHLPTLKELGLISWSNEGGMRVPFMFKLLLISSSEESSERSEGFTENSSEHYIKRKKNPLTPSQTTGRRIGLEKKLLLLNRQLDDLLQTYLCDRTPNWKNQINEYRKHIKQTESELIEQD